MLSKPLVSGNEISAKSIRHTPYPNCYVVNRLTIQDKYIEAMC
jgi:hypothetical protein